MTAPKPKPIGQVIDVPEGASITRPDGTTITVTGGAYALDVPGVHIIDGRDTIVEADGGTAAEPDPKV